MTPFGQFSRLGSLLDSFFIRVLYCIGDSKRGPNFENYPDPKSQAEDFTLGTKRALIWDFPKIRGTLFGGPYNKDPTI